MTNIFFYNDEYYFTTNEYFSSAFHSLEQLIDVGLDDPYKRKFYSNEDPLLSEELYNDITYLCSVKNFEDLPILYPELFI